ncbi:hypothetical protein TSUD_103760 [Trifolium subterraneum]|uniref:Uncharacterized protein n=1 Tax=Trifolium subterraneum TaxID=3900 RepID=A0A2Z6MM32_TRISU|nr:hypothetical protein TSUD_103760 [Trifolium subterraneum]
MIRKQGATVPSTSPGAATTTGRFSASVSTAMRMIGWGSAFCFDSNSVLRCR